MVGSLWFLGPNSPEFLWTALIKYNVFSKFSFVNSCKYVNIEYKPASLVAQMVKNLPAMQETRVWSLGWKDPLEKEMANPLQYSCLENSMDRGAWMQSMGLQKVRHDWAMDTFFSFKNISTEMDFRFSISVFHSVRLLFVNSLESQPFQALLEHDITQHNSLRPLFLTMSGNLFSKNFTPAALFLTECHRMSSV